MLVVHACLTLALVGAPDSETQPLPDAATVRSPTLPEPISLPEPGHGQTHSGLYLSRFDAFALASHGAPSDAESRSGAQHLQVGWEDALVLPALTLDAGVHAVMCPLAEPDAAELFVPAVIEPVASISYEGPVALELEAAYAIPVQPWLGHERLVHLRPSFDTLGAASGFDFGGSLGVGYRVFESTENEASGHVDVGAEAHFTWHTKDFDLSPSVNASWIDVGDGGQPAGVMVWGALSLGVGS